MIKVSFVTNGRTPYRKKQFEIYSEIPNVKFSIYYTNKNILEREWDVNKIEGVEEIPLRGIRVSKKYGFVNIGLKKIVKESDLIIIGGYEQPTYQILAWLCRRYDKKYIVLFDGISPMKMHLSEKKGLKYFLKKQVINGASAVFGNGTVSKKYFTEAFKYPEEKIFNQYLTVDIEAIQALSISKNILRQEYRNKYGISADKFVVAYSGRLIKIKNVPLIVEALKGLDNFHLMCIGDGEERENLLKTARQLGVDITITGFIKQQEELFKYYYAVDCLVLPSYDEAWGLVVNEAMAAGLPVIVSYESGASLDLVKDGVNGFILRDLNDCNKLKQLLLLVAENRDLFGKNSISMIKEWSFSNSKESLLKMLDFVLN